MGVIGIGQETYLYVNGISTPNAITLRDSVALLPVETSFHYGKVSDMLKSDLDYAVAAISGRNIASQIKITANTPKQLAGMAWNAQWDCLLLGAIFHCEAMSNIQCDKPVEQLEDAAYINITNYGFRAILNEPYNLTIDDERWINDHYSVAYKMLDVESYMTAIHSLASYRWHSMPRVQMAIIWSGIEALFQASTEISFRISLYIANYLAGSNHSEAEKIFNDVRKLYNARSASVHGSRIKGEINKAVSESAALLQRIIRHCAETQSLPDVKQLVFT